MSLGETIYKYRVSKNFSQGDLAEMLNVSRQSVSKWENNSATPDLDKIVKMSEIFGVTIDELVKGKHRQDTQDTVTSEVPDAAEPKITHTFLGRKIGGTILLCMAFLIVLFLCLNGAFGSGLILSIPFIVCGVICFIIKQNAGLWCAWTLYFMFDIYLRFMTGTTRSFIFSTYYYQYASEHISMRITLILSWALNLVLMLLGVITVLRFKKKPLEMNRVNQVMFILGIFVFIFVKVLLKISPTNEFIQEMYNRNYRFLPQIFFTSTDWLQIIIVETLVVNFVRYLVGIKAQKSNESR